MDFLRRIGRFIGGAAQNVGRAVQQAPRFISRGVQDAERARQQAVAQVQRNLPRFQAPPPPRIQLPQIQIPRVQLPQVRPPQAPRVDFGAVTRALQAPSQMVQRTTRDVLGQAGRTLGDLQRQSDAIRQRQIQQTQADIARFRTSPATAMFQTPGLSPFGGISQAFKTAKVGTGRELPKFDTTKAVEDLSKQLAKTPLRKIPGAGVVGDVLKPLAISAARMADVAQTQEEYDRGLKGIGQLGSDITNIASLVYSGGLSKQLFTKGTAFLPTAAKLAPRLAASGAGQNILLQLSEGKKINELDPKQIAAAAGVYTTLGVGIPGLTRVGGKAVSKVFGRGQSLAATRAAQVAPTPNYVTVFRAGEKGRVGDNYFTSNPAFAQNVKKDLIAEGTKPQIISRRINTNDYLDIRNPAQRTQLEDLLGPQKVQELLNAGSNGLPAVVVGKGQIKGYVGDEIMLRSAANRLGFKGIQISEGKDMISKYPNLEGVTFAKAIPQAKIKVAKEVTGITPTMTKPIYETVPESAMRPKAPKGQEALYAEARKFKSADEFIKAQGKPIYHGTDKLFKEFDVKKTPDGSIWFSDNLKSIQKGESGASGTQRIINRFINENKLKLAGWDQYDKYSLDQLQQMGFDGIKLPDNGKIDYQIFYPEKLQTKQQLTDIWKQANQATGRGFAPGTTGNIYETVPESAMRPKVPKGGKERGFITTVKESPKTEGATLTILKQTDGSYKIKSNKVLEKQANERIASNVADAKTYAITQSDDQAVATAGQLIKYYQARGDYGQAAEVASQAARTLTEAGRTIQAASLYNKLNPEGILQYASNKMQKVGRKLDPESAEILTNMAKKIEAMPDGESKQIAIKELLDEVGRTQGSALPDKIITLWKAGLLTSPITTAGNLTSNTIKQVVKKTADDPIAAIVDMTLSLATGKRTKTFTLKGLGEGGAEGFKRGAKYFKTGYDPRDPISKLDQKDVYFSKGFFGKAAQGYTDTVFRSLGAQDQPYFYAALKNTLYDEAIAAAKNKGVKGAAREKFIKDFINNTDTKVLDKATEEARTAVFQNKTFLGDMASKLTQSNNPATRTVAQFIMPFSRVPSAVATEIFERTPLGAAKEIVKQIAKKQYDQRALATAISKSTTGTIGLMGLGYALDRGGNINLAMPTSQAEQNLWQQEGRQPFSIKIGDKYYSMNYIQPFGSLIAMGAQYNRTLREGGSQQDALAASFAMGAKAVTEQSFLRGVSGALGALQDPGRYAERFVEQTAGSVIPNIVRTTARAIDPLQREITSAGEAVIAGIPGLRQRLQPKVDVFGQPIARPADAINTLFNPLRPTTAKSTPQIDEVRRLFNQDKNVIPSEIDKNAFGKANPINQQQINNLKTAMGNAVLDKYQQIIADPRYANLSDEQKAKALKDAKDAAIQGEKFKFAQANNLPYTAQDKLDKDTVAYLEGQEKDYIQATLPKPPKVKVSKARRKRRATGRRRGGRGRVAKVRVKAPKVPRVSVKGLPSAPKAKKVSFKVPKPKATARKSIKIKTG